ncbi:uncharacterized protein LOC105434766 [Cucumis sativus]|uniref:uncharacterized protein LOC105434766 n=1 Tax=Cucumis sativus TaxID=3659 RepID=UPI0005EC1263|nr:uncharacterized protein LOC105434766 [Cucumis sativus]KAE8652281.1 hypothetical protein Csa_022537 [Cucumis sativus]
MKILAWNVRGIGSTQKRVQIKHVISDYAPDFVCLSETKLLNVNNKLVKSIWSSISIKYIFKQVSGRSGGILLMWDDLKHQLINYVIGEFTISTNFVEADGYNWWITSVYDLVNRSRRKSFWQELMNLAQTCGSNWLLAGDFNAIRWNIETSSNNPFKYSMTKFNYLILNLGLVDPPLTNGSYTWSNLRDPLCSLD